MSWFVNIACLVVVVFFIVTSADEAGEAEAGGEGKGGGKGGGEGGGRKGGKGGKGGMGGMGGASIIEILPMLIECGTKEGFSLNPMDWMGMVVNPSSFKGKGKCILKCVCVKKGLIDESGNMNATKIDEYVGRFVKGPALADIKTQCLNQTETDVCEKVYKSVICGKEIHNKCNKKPAE